jgi:WD40 repeat protein
MAEQALSPKQEYPLSGSMPQILRVFGDLCFHTDGDLQALAFGADGHLWSIEDLGVLRQWNPSTGHQLRWTSLSDLETLWAISPDTSLIASASDDLTLWEVASGKVLESIQQPSWVTAVAFGPGGKLLATGHDDGVVRVWDVVNRTLRLELPGPKRPISALAFNSAGSVLASAGEDRVICLWDAEKGNLNGTLKGHTDRIQALAWHPTTHRLVSGGWDTTARVWNTQTLEPVILLNGHADQVTTLTFSPDGGLLACADSANAIHIWDAEAGKSLHVLKEHEEEIRCLTFTADGQRLASAGADRVIHLWDARGGRLLSGRGNPVLQRTQVAITPDGSRLASTCLGAGLRIWDTQGSGSEIRPQEDGALHVLASSSDGKLLAGGGSDNRVRIWEMPSGNIHGFLEGQKGKVAAAAFSPDGASLASASDVDGMVWLWNIKSREPVLVIPEAADACTVEALAFHPQGRYLAVGGIDWLATGGSDGAICIWDIEQNCTLAVLDRGATRVEFDATGRWLAAASLCESIYLWDMDPLIRDPEANAEPARELTGHSESVTCIGFSPDGNRLASGSDDRTLRLWNIKSGEVEAVCSLDTPIKALVFSPDGRCLFTGNGNTTSYQLEIESLLKADSLSS